MVNTNSVAIPPVKETLIRTGTYWNGGIFLSEEAVVRKSAGLNMRKAVW